jgi:hypothetical protein
MQYGFSLIKGKKKWNLETALWMSIWGCSSPATYCQPPAAAGFIYCRSQEWALHSPSPAGFVYLEFSWIHAPFVFSSIQHYPPVAIAVCFFFLFRVCVGSASPPLYCGACPSSAAVTSLPLSKHTGEGGTTPTFSIWLVYLQWGHAPPPLSGAQSAQPSLLCVFFVFQLLAYYSGFLFVCLFVYFFPWAGVSLSRGLCWFVPGSTTCCLFVHLVANKQGRCWRMC